MRQADTRRLVDRISVVQVVALAGCVAAGGAWLKQSFDVVVRRQILRDNTLIAEQLTALVAGQDYDGVEYGDGEWERLQRLVEGVTLPNDGFLCIADAGDGGLLCHPDIRDDPGLRGLKVAGRPLMLGDAAVPIATAAEEAAAGRAVSGVLGKGAATEVVSVASLPGVDGILMVHQREAGVRAAVTRLLAPVAGLAFSVGCVLIVVLRASAFRLIGRYESRLEVLNDRLEELNRGLEDQVDLRTRSLMKTRDAVIFGLATLAESRDNDTGDHLERIRDYVGILARALRRRVGAIDDRFIETIEAASPLHDIGKVAIADAVLLKPGRLDRDERAHMETHAAVGLDCLTAIDGRLGEDHFLDMAAEICGGHHEKWDGSGYPRGVAGEAIPLSARIVAVADVYDALRSKRPYKDPMPHEKAANIIREGRGGHFDPLVVDAFLEVENHFRDYSDAAARATSADVDVVDESLVDTKADVAVLAAD